jgi:hypothetical protein
MLRIVRLALIRPYTFIVLALLILIFGSLASVRTPIDIFPNIGIPVVSVVWNYTGLQPDDMSGRIVTYYERTTSLTSNLNRSAASASSRSSFNPPLTSVPPPRRLRRFPRPCSSRCRLERLRLKFLITARPLFPFCNSRSQVTHLTNRSSPTTQQTSFGLSC